MKIRERRTNLSKKRENGRISIFQVALIFFSLIFLIVYLFAVDGVSSLYLLIRPRYAGMIFLAALCMVVYWLAESTVLYLSMRSSSTHLSFGSIFRISMIGQYFNTVTPFSTGGQPALAYQLHKKGVSYGSAISGLFFKFLIYQLTLTGYCAVMLFLRFRSFREEQGNFVFLVLAGFAVQVFVSGLLLSAAFFKKTTTAAAVKIIDLLGRLRILKKTEEKKESVRAEIGHFHLQCKDAFRHKKRIVAALAVTLVQLTAYYLIGYILHCCFREDSVNFFMIIASQTFIFLVSSYIPIPGGVGTMEGSFYLFFKMYFPSSVLSLVIFLWRILTFYLPLLTGLFFLVTGKKKTDKESLHQDEPAPEPGLSEGKTAV